MKLSEIFYSIQGEGPHVGRPSLFIRTAGCNLHCPWCDTKYAWIKGVNVTLDSLWEAIVLSKARNVVFTGGEPTLYLEELSGVARLCYRENIHTTLETNGTILEPNHQEWTGFNAIVASPKDQKTLLKWIPYLGQRSFDPEGSPASFIYLKAVCDEANIHEVCMALHNDLKKWLYNYVYLMPKGMTTEEVWRNSHVIYDAIRDYELPVHLGNRMHVWMRVK